MKTLGGYYQGYDTLGISRHRLISRSGDPRQPSKHKPNNHGPSKPHRPRPSAKGSGSPRPLSSPFTKDNTSPHDLSSIPTLGWNGERSSSTKYACSDKGRHAPTYSTRIEGTAIPLVRIDTIPTPCCADKIAPPGGDDRYGDPPSKYSPIGWAYSATHYGIGLIATALTFKANQANEGHDLVARCRVKMVD
jgi:hypothetical protein